jgi:hypothetical protein
MKLTWSNVFSWICDDIVAGLETKLGKKSCLEACYYSAVIRKANCFFETVPTNTFPNQSQGSLRGLLNRIITMLLY